MDQRISLVTLGVTDLQASRRFYDALGWHAGFASDEVVFYQLNGCVLALWSRDALAADARLASGPGFEGVALAQNQPDRASVDRVLQEAVAAGGRLLRPAESAEWGGYTGYFADHDGHAWEIAWNPDWTLDAGGNVTLPA